MIDIQQEKDLRGIYINKVGIRAYVHPIKIKSLEGIYQDTVSNTNIRSEERRVGKECRSRGSPYH